jgi:signal transduction histidine kinase
MSSFLGVPIRVKGRSVGNFYLTNRQGASEFSEADEHLVEMFALHAGIAIENARLHEQGGQMAVVDERDRISKDLHDGIIQSIYGVSLSLEDVPQLIEEDPGAAAERVDRAIESLNVTIRDLRNFIFGLRPELADQSTLASGLATLARELRLNTLIDAEVEVRDDGFDLDADRRSEVLQIVREALSNVARHSRAAHVAIHADHDDREMRLAVTDDGRGFALDERREDAHHGLANMRLRAQRLGGRLLVESSQQGTRVTVLIPLMAAGAADHEPGGVQ